MAMITYIFSENSNYFGNEYCNFKTKNSDSKHEPFVNGSIFLKSNFLFISMRLHLKYIVQPWSKCVTFQTFIAAVMN